MMSIKRKENVFGMDLVKRTPGRESDLTDLKLVGDKVNFGYFVAYPDLQ